MGRKPIPASLKRGARLVVMLTNEEMQKLTAAAEAAHSESLSAWVRDTLLRAT